MPKLDKSKLRTQLEVGTKIAVWLAAGVVLLWVVKAHLNQPTPRSLPGLRKGDVIGALAKLNCDSAPRTLVLALNTRCVYCTESVPFYNEIAENARTNQVCVAAVFPEPEDDVRRYVQLQRLKARAVGGSDLTQFQVAVTPTMILIDDVGRVRDFWIGRLGEQEQRAFLGILRKEAVH